MGFIIFLIAGGVIFWIIIQRRNNIRDEWSRAASQLGLNYSGGGLVNPHWIYGKKDGLRYDIKTFTRSASGSANKWTGYRVRFNRPADLRIRLTETARNSLTDRFSECEIDDEGIFCARSGIESDASAIVQNVKRLLSVTTRLLATADEDAAEAEAEVPTHRPAPPPPIPEVNPEPAPAEAEAETVDPVPVTDPADESSPLEEPAESNTPEPEPVIELDEAEPADSEDPVVETEPQTYEEPESLLTLSKVSGDLFDSGRNRFQITRRFDAEYNGLSMLGEGKLVRAEPYSNDRVFGRGPGTLAEVEIHQPDEPLPGHNTIRAVVQLPETTSARSLRANLGDAVTISGTMLRCDAFEGRIFLGAGEIA